MDDKLHLATSYLEDCEMLDGWGYVSRNVGCGHEGVGHAAMLVDTRVRLHRF